jgi:hypothetical protein
MRLVIAILIAAALTLPASAQLLNAKSVRGQVTAKRAELITVRDQTTDHTVAVTDLTQVLLQSEVRPPEEIGVGDQVDLVYREDKDRKVALVVNIVQKK